MPQFAARAIAITMLGGSFAMFANMISFIMIGRINERVPDKERISYLWWSSQVRKRFKALYPASKLVFLLDACDVMMIVSFALLLTLWVFA